MAADSPNKSPRKPAGRSRITNGRLGDMDGRGKWARRFADLIQLYGADVAEMPSDIPAAVQSLIRRAATLTVELERAEASFAAAGKAAPTALAEYQTTSNSLRRLLQDLQVKTQRPEHISRPVSALIDNPRFIRNIHTGQHPVARAILPGIEPPPPWSITTADGATRRHLARAISFMISEAKFKGLPVPGLVAEFAVSAGMAEYDTDAEDIPDETE